MIKLTPTSYIVLGMVELAGEATPYTLKQGVAGSVGNFWSIPHSQLYAEPDRLATAGLLEVERESSGRRRKHYRLTASGRRALREWIGEPTGEMTELRDPGLLKLFFGADRRSLAEAQLEAHTQRLSDYLELRSALIDGGGDPEGGPLLTLEAGIAHTREWIRFWKRVGGL